MSTFRFMLPLFALLASGAALADCRDAGDGRAQCTGTVKTLHSDDGQPKAYFLLNGSVPSIPCSFGLPGGTPDGYWELEFAHPRFREWYTLLLTAIASNATISVVSKPSPSPSQICQILRLEIRP